MCKFVWETLPCMFLFSADLKTNKIFVLWAQKYMRPTSLSHNVLSVTQNIPQRLQWVEWQVGPFVAILLLAHGFTRLWSRLKTRLVYSPCKHGTSRDRGWGWNLMNGQSSSWKKLYKQPFQIGTVEQYALRFHQLLHRVPKLYLFIYVILCSSSRELSFPNCLPSGSLAGSNLLWLHSRMSLFTFGSCLATLCVCFLPRAIREEKDANSRMIRSLGPFVAL